MTQPNFKRSIWHLCALLFVGIFIISSCTSGKVFQKRKYTKGVYFSHRGKTTLPDNSASEISKTSAAKSLVNLKESIEVKTLLPSELTQQKSCGKLSVDNQVSKIERAVPIRLVAQMVKKIHRGLISQETNQRVALQTQHQFKAIDKTITASKTNLNNQSKVSAAGVINKTLKIVLLVLILAIVVGLIILAIILTG